jgi:hypothetical protein
LNCFAISEVACVSARGQIAHHRTACPAQQDRFEVFSKQIEILMAEHFALVVGDAVAVEESERGAEPPVVDELDDGEQIVQPILQRRAGQHQREW